MVDKAICAEKRFELNRAEMASAAFLIPEFHEIFGSNLIARGL